MGGICLLDLEVYCVIRNGGIPVTSKVTADLLKEFAKIKLLNYVPRHVWALAYVQLCLDAVNIFQLHNHHFVSLQPTRQVRIAFPVILK
jgi:hypothetical protein